MSTYPRSHHVAVDLGEQPLRPGHPAAADRRLPAGEQHQGQPERAAHRGERVTSVEVELVGALQRLHAVVALAEQIRRGGEPDEVVCGELICGGAGQPVVGRQPLAAAVGLTGPDQLFDYPHRAPVWPQRSAGALSQAAARFTAAERATIWRAT
jgi:hypothetical protein